MVVAVETQAVLLDDDLDELAEPNISEVVLLHRSKIADRAEGYLDIPLANGVRLSLK